jgi:hypothetical protein
VGITSSADEVRLRVAKFLTMKEVNAIEGVKGSEAMTM